MSRERDAIELIWEWLQKTKRHYNKHFTESEYDYHYGEIEQILTQMEDLIQDDLTLMESESRGGSNCRVTPKACPLLEEYKKSQAQAKVVEAVLDPPNPTKAWVDAKTLMESLKTDENTFKRYPIDFIAEGDTYSPI